MAGGVAGGVVAGGVAGAAGGYAYRASRPDPAPAGEPLTSGTLPAVPFHGQYQAGILPAAAAGDGGRVVRRHRREPRASW